jgi:hypothetical protein
LSGSGSSCLGLDVGSRKSFLVIWGRECFSRVAPLLACLNETTDHAKGRCTHKRYGNRSRNSKTIDNSTRNSATSEEKAIITNPTVK